ncbi:MAG TPA: type II secretion system protein GspG [Gemmataceae bacterium]|nr:type II secretion system protein GspG [Gemmataceae bacterium]
MPAPGLNRYWLNRILLCLATSLTVTGTAYVCAWLNYRHLVAPQESTEPTRAKLEMLRQGVDTYKAATGRWPENLSELPVVRDKKVLEKEGFPVDQWGWPIHYEMGEGTYKLYSNGKDGRPGGIGSAADLVAGQPDPAAGPPPTFARFLTDPNTKLLQMACILGGLAAFPLCLLQAAGKGGKRPTLGETIFINVVTAFFATVAALVIGSLHIIPGGH